MTIYDIKRLTEATAPHYFTRSTLKAFGQTMRDFKVYKQLDGRFMICAPRFLNGKQLGESVRYFNPTNNKLEHN